MRVSLIDVCDFQGGTQPPKEEWIDHPEPGYIRMLQIRDFTQPDKDHIEYIKETKTIKTCNADDILIGRYGASVGKILTGLSGAYNVAIIKTIPDNRRISNKYLFHYLNSPYFQNYILSVGSRAAQAGFNREDLKNALISLPDLDEQNCIVIKLDLLAQLISLRKQQLAKLDELVKARFVEMFGDLLVNPMEWKFQKLSTLCDVRDGTHDSPEYVSEGYPLLTSKNFTSGVIDFTDCNLISLADFEKINQRSKVDYGDIIMPMIGTIGHPVIVDTDRPFAIKNVALIKFGTKKISNIFVKHILDSDYFLNTTKEANRGGTQKFIALGDIRNIPVPIVPAELQKLFADFSGRVNRQKLTIQQSLDKLEVLKKSLMQEYFG